MKPERNGYGGGSGNVKDMPARCEETPGEAHGAAVAAAPVRRENEPEEQERVSRVSDLGSMSRSWTEPPPTDETLRMAREEPAISLIRLIPPATPGADAAAPLELDDDLVTEPQIREHDLDALFRRYSPYVAAIAHRLLGRDEEVDDTIQEVFLAAVRGLHALRDPAAIRAWLARVTVRSARQRLRKRRLRSFLGLEDAASYDAVVDRGASAEHRALVSRVYRVLDCMPANHRIAWCLRHVEGEPLESVAALSGCSLATAKRRIAAAAQQIEEAFADG